ncbi:CDP-alcohol phosphatidyltransferase family protein [Acidomonas methanolica]|uniref:CDP-diacylglycerol--serine O-phosphatidyltransferase n=1 Tax=Acidomonas methanolica NBRC 104435 TaxID=1231351 RepID=A0A023D2S8_ACIMT|nr:phosphatidylcholine/phosphatidylserine synthase [Acidomonas methanolica]MBU2654581.1 phosphatidylcholine/phosphatidylserine synthase [Acidomonas methanolica]TCS27454.1 CDP-diacylglycerol--serine O-phosphatidyltransferase [Acidomonas methanolica]GAJ28065.1 CDP-diacylglycerol--serine O-phosphatidyltransferase [Acidomonas methanolica NBRC 104435]GBQ51813.1 CDP-diacylglycerol--serine O-phosphatidyltransferase [Acidomonas methanolica]GEK98639.1 CDP-diacylglycerol--serine O-phosphatidyltransferas
MDPSLPPARPKRRIRRLRRLGRPRRVRVRGPSFNRLIPNILTMLGLCSGLSGMQFAIERRFAYAAAALLISACIDGLDGRIARLLHGTSRFGAEFDSLSDFVCFGVAPSILLYMWALQHTGRYSFIPCIMFTVCMALRLARFNASLDDDDKPAYSSSFFTGVPAPAGAGLVLFPVFLGLEANKMGWTTVEALSHAPLATVLCLVVTAALLVSTLPVWSFKNFKIPTPYVLPVMLGTCGFAAVLIADPWGALAAAGLIYLAMLPFSRRSYHRLRREAEAISEFVE